MALRRHGLSQRRKAVGFTQESLAEHLGVERSTVVRWEAGDTEPLPSIRPRVARALHVSIDQLTELLTQPENPDTTPAPSADAEVTTPEVVPEGQSQVRPVRAELEDVIRSQVAETVEAVRRALRSAGVSPEHLDAMLPVGRSSQVSPVAQPVSTELDRPAAVDTHPQATIGEGVSQPTQTEVSHPPSLTTIPLDVEPADVAQRRVRSRRFTRFAAAGFLALVLAGAAASVPWRTSHSGSIPPAAAPPAAAETPAPDPGSSNDSHRSDDSTGAGQTTPAAAPDGDPVPPGATAPGVTAVPAPHTQTTSDSRTTSRSKPPTSTTPPASPRTPAWVKTTTDAASRTRDRVGRVGQINHPRVDRPDADDD